jgi:type II secretory pathway component GspD/PulD (secretin)
MKNVFRVIFMGALLTFAQLILVSEDVVAAPLPQENAPYTFMDKSRNLREVLEVFGENIGIPVRLSERVEGEIDPDFMPHTRNDFLNRLGARHNFMWFYDGGILHISSIYDLQTRFFSLVQWSSHEVANELKKMGVWDGRFIAMQQSGTRTLIVTGPEVYIQLVEGAITEITKSTPDDIKVIVGMKRTGRTSNDASTDTNSKESFADQYAIEGVINQPMVNDGDAAGGLGIGSVPVLGDDI